MVSRHCVSFVVRVRGASYSDATKRMYVVPLTTCYDVVLMPVSMLRCRTILPPRCMNPFCILLVAYVCAGIPWLFTIAASLDNPGSAIMYVSVVLGSLVVVRPRIAPRVICFLPHSTRFSFHQSFALLSMLASNACLQCLPVTLASNALLPILAMVLDSDLPVVFRIASVNQCVNTHHCAYQAIRGCPGALFCVPRGEDCHGSHRG